MSSGKSPKLSASDRRAQRERDAELQRERLNRDRQSDARRRRALGFSMLVGPGGEQGSAGPKLGVGV